MLLVGYGEGEGIEFNILLDQGVRADNERNLAAFKPRFDPPLLRCGGRAGQQRDGDIGILKEFCQSFIVLHCEHFRWRHKGALAAVHGAVIYQRRADRRFARADVALQQSVHRHAAAHILRSLSDGSPLSARQFKGQSSNEIGGVIAFHCYSRPLAVLGFKAHKPQLKQKKLLEYQPPASLGEHIGALRSVDILKRVTQTHQAIGGADILRYRVLDIAAFLERTPHELLYGP